MEWNGNEKFASVLHLAAMDKFETFLFCCCRARENCYRFRARILWQVETKCGWVRMNKTLILFNMNYFPAIHSGAVFFDEDVMMI